MAGKSYINFQKFSSKDDAIILLETLKENGVVGVIENSSPSVDVTFSANNMQDEFIVKIESINFEKANSILEELAKINIGTFSKDHYLYEFTNEELMEIIEKPDEWCKEDYFLSQHILKERGEIINQDKVEELKQKRIDDLRKPEKANTTWIALGYFMALFGGLAGVFIGWFHWSFKKTDPLGERVYVYDKVNRKKGRNLFWFGMVFQIIWIFIWIKYGFF